ncbi:MAG: sulfurtransferase [Endozoicomonas sp.]
MAWQRLDRPTLHGSVSQTRARLHGAALVFVRLTIVALLFGQAGAPAAGSASLFSPWELKQRMKSDEPLLIIDVRPPIQYLLRHLPGAYNLWRPAFQANDGEYPYQGMRANRQKLAAQLSTLGARPDILIVLYDGHDGTDAAHLWWLLKLYGHKSVAILNGGLKAWKAANYKTSLKPAGSPAKTKYQFSGREHSEYLAELPQVKQASEDNRTLLVDVRSYEEYSGVTRQFGAYRKGRIPGSIWFDYRNAVDETGFVKAEKLKQALQRKGITEDKEIILYCQSGVRSAHSLFVLTQLLDYPNVRNYDGSWVEWSWHRALPALDDTKKTNTFGNKAAMVD